MAFNQNNFVYLQTLNTNKMEQTTDKQMTLAEFRQWLESMEQEARNMVSSCEEKSIENSEIWGHQWVAYKWVLKQLNKVVCE